MAYKDQRQQGQGQGQKADIIKLNDNYFQNISRMNSPRMTTNLSTKKMSQVNKNNNNKKDKNELCNCM